MNLYRTQLVKKPCEKNRYTEGDRALGGRKFWARRRARRARAPAPTAPPPHPRTAEVLGESSPSTWQLCAHGPNVYFSNRYTRPDSAPQAAAIEHGYFGAAAAPRSARHQVRCVKAGTARGGNARRSSHICWFNSFRSWINFCAAAAAVAQ